MKRRLAFLVAFAILFSLAACAKDESATAAAPEKTAEAISIPVAKPTAKPTAEPALLSAEYADMLKNSPYYYCLTATAKEYVIEVTAAGRDGCYYARMDSQDKPIRQMVLDGVGYAVYEPTGEMNPFDPASEADVIPDFSTLTYLSTAEDSARTTDTYTFKMLDGKEKKQLFVFENGKLIEMTTPEVLVEGTWPVSYFNAEPPAELFVPPVKTTLAIKDIAEGAYTGTLSGDSYSSSDNETAYSINSDIPPCEISATFKDGQVELYATASVTAGGVVYGAETPRSPAYTQTVSGSLPLAQVDATTVRAEGDLTTAGEGLHVSWKNKKFTKWDVEKRDLTHHCTVTVMIVDGVPAAEITVDGSASHRTATVPLRLAAQGEQPADTVQVLWTNSNTSEVENGAKDYYEMFELPAFTVTELETYHFKSDGKKPGQLMLYGEDGGEYGPFDAVGREGQGGVKNAYWVAEVSIELPAGKYAIADSDQKTWSSNAETDGWGMATVRGERNTAMANPLAAGGERRTVENQSIEIALSWSKGTILYTGAVDAEGLPDGEGTGTMEADADGTSWEYTGLWAHGRLSGQGELAYPTENYALSGTFLNDYLTYGTQTQDGVLRYDGEWLDGDLHGQGKLYTKAGDLLYEGKFDHSLLSETQAERERRAAPFMESCEDLDKKLYAKLNGKNPPSGDAVAVKGTIIGMSEQNEKGTVIINMQGSSKYPVALRYRYGKDEPKMTAKSGDLSACGYCAGTFSYTKDGKQATCPHIEVVYWTTE